MLGRGSGEEWGQENEEKEKKKRKISDNSQRSAVLSHHERADK